MGMLLTVFLKLIHNQQKKAEKKAVAPSQPIASTSPRAKCREGFKYEIINTLSECLFQFTET